MILRKEGLTRAVEAVIAAGGSEAREARLVAENLVTANLLGHDSHGIGMVPRYIDALLEGGLAANQHPKPTLDAVSAQKLLLSHRQVDLALLRRVRR